MSLIPRLFIPSLPFSSNRFPYHFSHLPLSLFSVFPLRTFPPFHFVPFPHPLFFSQLFFLAARPYSFFWSLLAQTDLKSLLVQFDEIKDKSPALGGGSDSTRIPLNLFLLSSRQQAFGSD